MPRRGALLASLLIAPLGAIQGRGTARAVSREWVRAFRWDRVLHETFRDLGVESSRSDEIVAMAEALVGYGEVFRAAALEEQGGRRLLETWLSDGRIHGFLQVNQFEGTWWLGKEPWEALLGGLAQNAEIESAADPTLDPREREKRDAACRRLVGLMREAAASAGYRVDRLMAALTGAVRPPAKEAVPAGRKRARKPRGGKPR